MSNPLKSFSELGDLYEKSVLLAESKTENDLGFSKAGHQKDDGPEAAEGFKKKVSEKKSPSKKPEKAKMKESVEPVSTKNMQPSKLKFDELYERALNEGPDSVVEPVTDDLAAEPTGAVADDETAVDTTADVEAEPVDPKELFTQLCDLVMKLKDFYGVEDTEEVDDGAMEDGVGSDDIEDLPTKESVETQEVPDSKGQSLQGKSNNVGGVKVVKKKAADGSLKEEPAPKELGDKKTGLMGKNNKVGGTGAQAKTGASAFES